MCILSAYGTKNMNDACIKKTIIIFLKKKDILYNTYMCTLYPSYFSNNSYAIQLSSNAALYFFPNVIKYAILLVFVIYFSSFFSKVWVCVGERNMYVIKK